MLSHADLLDARLGELSSLNSGPKLQCKSPTSCSTSLIGSEVNCVNCLSNLLLLKVIYFVSNVLTICSDSKKYCKILILYVYMSIFSYILAMQEYLCVVLIQK